MDEIQKMVKDRKLNVEDVMDLAARLNNSEKYRKDATELIKLATENATTGEIFKILTKYVNKDDEVTKTLADKWEKICGYYPIETNKKGSNQLRIDLNTAVKILRDHVIENVDYLKRVMLAMKIGEEAGQAAQMAVDDVKVKIVMELKSQENVKA